LVVNDLSRSAKSALLCAWSRVWRMCAVSVALGIGIVACGGGGGGGSGSDSAGVAASASPGSGTGSVPSQTTPLGIAVQPEDLTVVVDATAVFSVTVAGPASYQWQRQQSSGWVDVPGARSAALSMTGARLADDGAQFRVIVTSTENPANVLISSVATLTVRAAPVPPSISVQPTDLALVAGQSGTLSVTAAGTSLMYQWQRSVNGVDFVDIPAANASTLALPPVSLADSGSVFRVTISNALGALTSAAARLAVSHAPAAPVFINGPASLTVVAGQTARFSIDVIGAPTPTLVWQSSSDAVHWTDVADQSAAVLVVPAPTLADNGRHYRVVATNDSGTVASADALLSVTAAPAVPIISSAPADVTVGTGGTATFTVAVAGVPTPSLQWQLSIDGGAHFANINGATATTYTLVGVGIVDDSKLLRVVAQNASGSVTSSAARLSVIAGPSITLQPQAQAWRSGLPAPVFRVQAAGTGLSYQWQIRADGSAPFVDVAGANGDTASITPTTFGASVRVAVTNAAGAITFSEAAPLSRLRWSPLSRSPTIDTMRSVRWLDANTLVAAGDAGSIVRSTDAGLTWQVVREADASHAQILNGLDIGPASTAIAVGQDGVILHSTDGGQHWVIARPAVVGAPTLRTVAFSGTNALAVGEGGLMLRSTDGGANWTSVPTGVTDGFTALAFRGSIGLAVTTAGDILRSVNGGVQWSRVAPQITREYDTNVVAFASDSVVVVTGTQSVTRSTDGGVTWQSHAQDSYFGPSDAVFTSPTTGIAVPSAQNDAIYATSDGGVTWMRRSSGWLLPVAQGYTPGMYAARQGPDGTLVAVGGSGVIRRSTDAGANWSRVDTSTVPNFGSLWYMSFSSVAQGVAGGPDGLFRTTDGGAHWSSVGANVHHGATWQSVAFVNAMTVLALDQQGQVAASVDGGATWAARGSAVSTTVEGGMAFANASLGLVATDTGGMARTTDGGATWNPVTSISDCFKDVTFANASVVVASSCAGILYRSTDGGLTWRQVRGIAYTPLQVRFADANTAVAIGSEISPGVGIVLRSTDGGTTWNTVAMPASETWYSSAWFSSATEGFIAAGGSVLHSRDGGATWELEMKGRSAGFSAGQALPDGTSVLVTGGGVVMKRSN